MALEQEPEISKLINEIAIELGLETRGFESRLKSKGAYRKKIEKNGCINKCDCEITDILRYTYISSPDTLVEVALKVIDELKRRGYETVEIKNYWLKPFNPYNGINTVIVSPSGLKFELQYHTVESYEIREKIHELYEKWRSLPETSTKAKKLYRKMFEGYQGTIVPKDIKKVK